jgi:hypothetical protein
VKNSPKKRQTAEEFLKELQADPAYRAMRAEQERRMQVLREQDRIEEAPIVEALREVGVNVESPWDLVNTGAPYPAAIPVLLEHFTRPYSTRAREGIARALAVPEAAWAWDVLVTWFRNEPTAEPSGVKYALGCALSAAATDDVVEKLIDLVRDTSLGGDRTALLPALARSERPKARAALEALRTDSQLSRQIRILIGSRKRS